MKTILELEKRGYVFSVSAGVLTFTAPSEKYATEHENELRTLFTELANHKAQAVAYLLARDMPAGCMVAIEDMPAFRARYGVRIVRAYWSGGTPTLELAPEARHA